MKKRETLELKKPKNIHINKLQRNLAAEIKKFGKHVNGKVLQEIQAKKLQQAKGKVGRREKVQRNLFTPLRLITIDTHNVK